LIFKYLLPDSTYRGLCLERGARTQGDHHADRHGPGEKDQGIGRAALIGCKDDAKRRRKIVYICLVMKPTKLKIESVVK